MHVSNSPGRPRAGEKKPEAIGFGFESTYGGGWRRQAAEVQQTLFIDFHRVYSILRWMGVQAFREPIFWRSEARIHGVKR
jgi:hypothetical protein